MFLLLEMTFIKKSRWTPLNQFYKVRLFAPASAIATTVMHARPSKSENKINKKLSGVRLQLHFLWWDL